MLGVPGKVFARKLALDEFGIFGEEQNAALETDHVGALGNGAVQQRDYSLRNFTAENARLAELERHVGQALSLLFRISRDR